MGMLEVHENALNSSNVPYHEFLLPYKVAERVVYGLVEGKDDPSFYRGIIEHSLPDGWNVELIRAGNKNKVLKVLNSMDWSRFPKKCVCFFVDRDLSEFMGEEHPSGENLYVTDNYSIENDAITFGTMKRVLEEILNITELDPAETRIIQELFEFNLNTFQESIVPIMSQIVIWRRSREEVDLNNIKLKEFFTFVEGKINLEERFVESTLRVEYAARCVNAAPSTNDELANAEVDFRSRQGPEKFIRGKYLLWFFVECALKLHCSIPKFCAKHSRPPKVRSSLSIKNAMVEIGPRVRCPESLKCFIERNYLEYIEEAKLVA
ncbi:MAG: DUF4435 domain-containing protein [Methanosarcina sp.]